MALFTVEDRKRVLERIISLAQRNEHIVALIAVGSGSFGYVDELSDLDFVVAIDKSENLSLVQNYVAEQLGKHAEFIYFKQAPHIPLQVYLCDNFLEIDIGYGVYTSAAATREHWKVLFDKTGTIQDAMYKSWEKAKNNPRTDEYEKLLSECADQVWHNLMLCAIAIKRKQCWRAAAELDIVRNSLIKILGFRYSLDTERGKEIDKLPESVLNTLQTTLCRDFSQQTLWLSLTRLTDAIYTELERNAAQAHIKVNRQQLLEFISSCLPL